MANAESPNHRSAASAQGAAVIDPDLMSQMLRAQASSFEPGDDALFSRVGARLSQAMAQSAKASESTAPTTVSSNLGDGRWVTVLPGVQRKTLMRFTPTDVAVLLRLSKGASLPPHAHAKPEDCVVISGELRIGMAAGGSGVQLQAGGFHWMAQGTEHEAIVALEESVIYLRGALDTVQ